VAAKNKLVRGTWGGSPEHEWTGRLKADNILLMRWGVTGTLNVFFYNKNIN